MKAPTFIAKLEPVPHGGNFVVVPEKVAKAAGLRHSMRVRGTVNGAPYRSSLMMYGGIFHLGVHKATMAAAGVNPLERVTVSIELDDEPLPTDKVPSDLEKALKRSKQATAAWKTLRPSLKRELVKSILDAKKAETRARRVEKVVASLEKSRGKRRTA